MKNTFAGPLPRHLYVWVDSNFTHKEPCGLVPAVWFGMNSYPGRAWGLNVMLENGAIYRNLPPHAITFSPVVLVDWPINKAQFWDCYGWDWTALIYPYLDGLACRTIWGDEGQYLFSVAPVGDAFSAYPEQAKEFLFIQLDNNRLTIQPTNHVFMDEKSFTLPKTSPTPRLVRQNKVWHCE